MVNTKRTGILDPAGCEIARTEAPEGTWYHRADVPLDKIVAFSQVVGLSSPRHTIMMPDGSFAAHRPGPQRHEAARPIRKAGLLSVVTAGLFMVASALPAYGDISIRLRSSLGPHADTFTATVDSSSPGYAILQPPASPSGGIEVYTQLDLMRYTAYTIPDFGSFQLRTRAVDPLDIGFSGINTFSVDITGDQGNLGIQLIDYGNDASRTTPIATHDFMADPIYEKNVDNALGTYGYLDLIITPEPKTAGLLVCGLAFLYFAGRRFSKEGSLYTPTK